jgi:hypothetical protein
VAATHWRRLLEQVPADTEFARQIGGGVREAERRQAGAGRS